MMPSAMLSAEICTEKAEKAPKYALQGITVHGHNDSPAPGELEWESMSCEPITIDDPSPIARHQRANSIGAIPCEEDPWRQKMSRLPFRVRKAKRQIEVDRSSRRSLERVRLTGNLFDDDPEEGQIDEDDMLERREFVIALMASLLKFGAATHLVENLMVSVADALHIRSQCNAFPKMLFLTFRSPDKDPSKMQSRVLSLSPGMDLGKLDECDLLATQVGAKLMPFEDAKAELNRILMQEPVYHWTLRLLAFTLVGSSATMLFYGGQIIDGAVAAGLGLLVGLLDLYGQSSDSFARVNDFVCAFLCAAVSRLLHFYVFPDSSCYFSAALGPLVYLLPGFSTTTGVMEVSSGSVMSGSARIFAAFASFLQLGFGLVVGSRIAVWETISESDWCSNDILVEYKVLLFLPCVFSLGVLFKIPPSVHLIAAVASAAIGFSVATYLEQYKKLSPDTLVFISSCCVGAFGGLYARIANRPPITIVVIGVLVLVPGGIGVRGVAALFSNDTVSGVTLGTQMFGTALSITLGLLVSKMMVLRNNHKTKRYYQPSLL